jgi:hypothetical protein
MAIPLTVAGLKRRVHELKKQEANFLPGPRPVMKGENSPVNGYHGFRVAHLDGEITW